MKYILFYTSFAFLFISATSLEDVAQAEDKITKESSEQIKDLCDPKEFKKTWDKMKEALDSPEERKKLSEYIKKRTEIAVLKTAIGILDIQEASYNTKDQTNKTIRKEMKNKILKELKNVNVQEKKAKKLAKITTELALYSRGKGGNESNIKSDSYKNAEAKMNATLEAIQRFQKDKNFELKHDDIYLLKHAIMHTIDSVSRNRSKSGYKKLKAHRADLFNTTLDFIKDRLLPRKYRNNDAQSLKNKYSKLKIETDKLGQVIGNVFDDINTFLTHFNADDKKCSEKQKKLILKEIKGAPLGWKKEFGFTNEKNQNFCINHILNVGNATVPFVEDVEGVLHFMNAMYFKPDELPTIGSGKNKSKNLVLFKDLNGILELASVNFKDTKCILNNGVASYKNIGLDNVPYFGKNSTSKNKWNVYSKCDENEILIESLVKNEYGKVLRAKKGLNGDFQCNGNASIVARPPKALEKEHKWIDNNEEEIVLSCNDETTPSFTGATCTRLPDNTIQVTVEGKRLHLAKGYKINVTPDILKDNKATEITIKGAMNLPKRDSNENSFTRIFDRKNAPSTLQVFDSKGNKDATLSFTPGQCKPIEFKKPTCKWNKEGFLDVEFEANIEGANEYLAFGEELTTVENKKNHFKVVISPKNKTDKIPYSIGMKDKDPIVKGEELDISKCATNDEYGYEIDKEDKGKDKIKVTLEYTEGSKKCPSGKLVWIRCNDEDGCIDNENKELETFLKGLGSKE